MASKKQFGNNKFRRMRHTVNSPSLRYSQCLTGPNAPGSSAVPGTGTDSAMRKSIEAVNSSVYVCSVYCVPVSVRVSYFQHLCVGPHKDSKTQKTL